MILAHDVYFTLHDASDLAKAKLVAACLKYLCGYEGCLYLSAGARASGFDRGVNDQAFHVALHVGFTDRAAHDAYQNHPRHKEFIEESRPNWKEVRVFDSWVTAASAPGK
jgi:hypothetical protein